MSHKQCAQMHPPEIHPWGGVWWQRRLARAHHWSGADQASDSGLRPKPLSLTTGHTASLLLESRSSFLAAPWDLEPLGHCRHLLVVVFKCLNNCSAVTTKHVDHSLVLDPCSVPDSRAKCVSQQLQRWALSPHHTNVDTKLRVKGILSRQAREPVRYPGTQTSPQSPIPPPAFSLTCIFLTRPTLICSVCLRPVSS